MEIAQTLDRLKKNPYVSLIGRFCGVATLIGSVVSDVLRPLAPYALYASLAFGLAVPLIVLMHMLVPVDGLAKRLFGQYWDKPIMAAVFISALMLLATHAFSDRNPSGNGFLGSHFELVAEMQKDLGIVRESVVKIEEHTRKISENTQAISQNTREINEKIDNVKRETSDDPRKELANLNVTWSVESFVESLMEGDLNKINLFLRGGMKPEALHNGSSALLYALQPNLSNDPSAVLKVVMDSGFDLNTHLIDRVILDHWSNGTLPARFETDKTPKGYTGGYLGGEFVGPPLLWVTILTTYRGASESDIAAIDFLLSQGAEAETALSYLEYSRNWLEDTTPYQQIYPLIQRGG